MGQSKSKLRDEIISGLFTGKNFNDAISKLEPDHLRDDLKQEVILVVCEWIDDKVIGLHQEGKLEFYVVRVMINMLTNKYHPFYKKFRQFGVITQEEFVDDASDDFDAFDDRHEHHLNCVARSKEIHKFDFISGMEERRLKEELEDFTIEQIDTLYWYDRDLIKIYLQVGTYRKITELTGIPYPSCYKNIQKSLEILRGKAASPRPLFTKEETAFIQNNKKK